MQARSTIDEIVEAIHELARSLLADPGRPPVRDERATAAIEDIRDERRISQEKLDRSATV